MTVLSIPPGTHSLGPDNGSLRVSTSKGGMASNAGHDLLIEVGSWTASLRNDEGRISITLRADGGSLRVLEGSGGIQTLGEDDKSSIRRTIDDEVLKRAEIKFQSGEVEASRDGDRLDVQGELELVGERRPVRFDLTVDADDRLTGNARVKQTSWGIKPYSALFGTLKVADEVVVSIAAKL